MENIKFEIAKASAGQLKIVENILNNTSFISTYKITPYLKGYLLSIQGINIECTTLLAAVAQQGINAERLYEE